MLQSFFSNEIVETQLYFMSETINCHVNSWNSFFYDSPCEYSLETENTITQLIPSY